MFKCATEIKLTIIKKFFNFMVGLIFCPCVDDSNSFGCLGKLDFLDLGMEVDMSDPPESKFYMDGLVHKDLIGYFQCNIGEILKKLNCGCRNRSVDKNGRDCWSEKLLYLEAVDQILITSSRDYFIFRQVQNRSHLLSGVSASAVLRHSQGYRSAEWRADKVSLWIFLNNGL